MGTGGLSLKPARICLIIGARGTGKSHFLRLLRPLFPQALFFDLDQEIEKCCRAKIPTLFLKGERFFRKKEQEIFHQIIKKIPPLKLCFIAVGAGFVFKKEPSWHVIWLCRRSDALGRVFFNRPRLTPNKSPYQEHKRLYEKRKNFYAKQADECLLRREHFKEIEDSDKVFLGLKTVLQACFSLRLNPEELPKDPGRLKEFLQKRLNSGVRFFELSDETASLAFVKKIKALVPEDRLLFSSMVSGKLFARARLKNHCWDLSLGLPPKNAGIVSLHERGKKALARLLSDFSLYKNRHLKLAIEMENLQELKTAYDWWSQDPLNRSFLPRSNGGLWLWFRQIFGPKMPLHFIRERPGGGVLDQPFFSEALPFMRKDVGAFDSDSSSNGEGTNKAFRLADESSLKPHTLDFLKERPAGQSGFLKSNGSSNRGDFARSFMSNPKGANHLNKKEGLLAGVLGDPVISSRTPFEQGRHFFNQRGIPVVALPLKEEEMTKQNLNILRSFGFVFFAVTAPLKRQAFLCAKVRDKKTMALGTANTLIWDGRVWQGFNTDEEGLHSLRAYSSPNTVVWGGGGIRPVLQKLMPKARFYSARSGRPLVQKDFVVSNGLPAQAIGKSPVPPQVLVWAVGRSRMHEGALMPLKQWRPRHVIDINYTEDSPGREYALQTGAKYTSGQSFFEKQAQAQRRILQTFKKVLNED